MTPKGGLMDTEGRGRGSLGGDRDVGGRVPGGWERRGALEREVLRPLSSFEGRRRDWVQRRRRSLLFVCLRS